MDQVPKLINLIEEKNNLTAQIQSENDAIQSKAKDSPLEKILNNSGFKHLAENIFSNMTDEYTDVCRDINQSSKSILDNPMFYLRKFKNISKENQKVWFKFIQAERNSKKLKAIISYLQWNLKKNVVDLLCYNSPAAQDDFRKKIWKSCRKLKTSDEDTEIVKILAPLTDNPNFPDKHGRTPSEVATSVEIKDLILEYSSEKCSVGRFTKQVSKKLAKQF